MKINKKSLVNTSLVILLPVLIGILLWNQLPSQMATHFDISGTADGYNSKIFAIFAFPILFLLFQLIVLVSLEKDSVKATTPARMVKIYAWLIPLLSLIVQLSIYANALGVIKSSPALVTAFLGSIFIFIGNYLPKTQRIIRLAFVCHGHFLMTAIGIKRTVLLVRFGCWVACFFYLIVFSNLLYLMFWVVLLV